MLLAPGDQLRTESDRLITVPRLAGRLEKRRRHLDIWLHAEATADAAQRGTCCATKDRGDWLQTLLRAMTPSRLSPADRDLLNDVLFGDERGARACHRVHAA